jgi:hypothetical protein
MPPSVDSCAKPTDWPAVAHLLVDERTQVVRQNGRTFGGPVTPSVRLLPLNAAGSVNPKLAVWRTCASHEIGVLRARYVRQSFPPHFHETWVGDLVTPGARS